MPTCACGCGREVAGTWFKGHHVRVAFDHEEAVRRYEDGETLTEIATVFGCAPATIRSRIAKAGVRLRKGGPERHTWVPTPRGARIIDGLLLGDASVAPSPWGTARLTMTQHEDRLGWLEQSRNALGAEALVCRIHAPTNKSGPMTVAGKVAYVGRHFRFSSCFTESLFAVRQRWYPAGKKLVPVDLCLDAESVAYWICGDGWGSPSEFGICTDGFSLTCVEILRVALLRDLGILARIKKGSSGTGWALSVGRKDDQVMLRNVTAPFIPECCQYKFRHIRPPKKRDGRNGWGFQARWNDAVVRAVRGDVINGASLRDAGAAAGMAKGTVYNLMRNQCYARAEAWPNGQVLTPNQVACRRALAKLKV